MNVTTSEAREAAAAQAAPKSRRVLWLAILGVLLILAFLAYRLVAAMHANTAAVAPKTTVPTVSVIEVGISSMPTTVSITGAIAAHYDMPIGAEGDAGRVSAIYVEAGDHVRKGQVLARLNVSVLEPQVANLQAALEQSHAEAELAAAEYKRAEAVGASGALSIEETQRRKSSSVTAAAKVKFAEAQLAEARAKLARAEIRAPEDGLILTRNVEVGQIASPGGEALFRLSKGGEVEMRGQVAEQDLPLLKVGQVVEVRLTGSTKPYAGKIRLLGAVIDPTTRLGMARIALDPDPNLRPGAFARADVTISNAQRAVLPQTAVLADERGSYVLIVNEQNKVERMAVKVTGMVPSGVTLADGLPARERVIATAGAFLQEGETVSPVPLAAASVPGKAS